MKEHSIKSEQYFGVAWENATPEQKQLVWDALSQTNNKENTMNDTTTHCQAITKKGTQHTTSNATNDIGGIGVCGMEAHINWAKEELERRMNEIKKEKKMTKPLSKNDKAMLRRVYVAMRKAGYPQSWLDRITQIAEGDDRAPVQDVYAHAKNKGLI